MVHFQGMKCPHCGKEIGDTVEEPAEMSRQELITWLTTWRKDNGLENSGRPLSNRSLPQLRKMYEYTRRREDHHLAVHREELVVGIGLDEIAGGGTLP